MLDGIEKIIEMFLRLNRSTPTFRTIRELPGFASIPGTRREQRLEKNRPIHHMLDNNIKTKITDNNNKTKQIIKQKFSKRQNAVSESDTNTIE